MKLGTWKGTSGKELYEKWGYYYWDQSLRDLDSLRKEIPLPDFEDPNADLMLVNAYFSQAELCYIFDAFLGTIALSASAVECFLKILMPQNLKYKGKPYKGRPPLELSFGPLIDLAAENGILAGDNLEGVRNLNKHLRIPYVHSKMEEILQGKEIVETPMAIKDRTIIFATMKKSRVTRDLVVRGVTGSDNISQKEPTTRLARIDEFHLVEMEDALEALRFARIVLRDLYKYWQAKNPTVAPGTP